MSISEFRVAKAYLWLPRKPNDLGVRVTPFRLHGGLRFVSRPAAEKQQSARTHDNGPGTWSEPSGSDAFPTQRSVPLNEVPGFSRVRSAKQPLALSPPTWNQVDAAPVRTVSVNLP